VIDSVEERLFLESVTPHSGRGAGTSERRKRDGLNARRWRSRPRSKVERRLARKSPCVKLAGRFVWNHEVLPPPPGGRAREGMSEVRFRVRSQAAKGDHRQGVYRRCAGLDVHKDSLTATILVFPEKGERAVRTKEFRSYGKDLQRLAPWLRRSLVECVAMESTGVDWKPIGNVREKTLR
jgi:hypothetical protein